MADNIISDNDENSMEFEGFAGSIKPYSYEPMKRNPETICTLNNDTSSSDEEDDDDKNDENTESNTWCSCDICESVQGQENRCCLYYSKIRIRLEGTQYTCITKHPGFQSNCLDMYVLEASFYEHCQQEGPIGDDEFQHDILRYLSYRRFVRWIFKKLGKNVRKIIPCCAIKAIRAAFPAESGQYTGFKYPFE